MKNNVMAYRLGDIIRKQNNNIKKPDDIGTKPMPKWLQNKNAKDEIEWLFKETTKNELL
jgi:hypothetical protein